MKKDSSLQRFINDFSVSLTNMFMALNCLIWLFCSTLSLSDKYSASQENKHTVITYYTQTIYNYF